MSIPKLNTGWILYEKIGTWLWKSRGDGKIYSMLNGTDIREAAYPRGDALLKWPCGSNQQSLVNRLKPDAAISPLSMAEA